MGVDVHVCIGDATKNVNDTASCNGTGAKDCSNGRTVPGSNTVEQYQLLGQSRNRLGSLWLDAFLWDYGANSVGIP